MHEQRKILKKIFYYRADNVKSQWKSQVITIVVEEMNAKFGKAKNGEIDGKFGQGTRSGKWVKWLTVNDHVEANISFQE